MAANKKTRRKQAKAKSASPKKNPNRAKAKITRGISKANSTKKTAAKKAAVGRRAAAKRARTRTRKMRNRNALPGRVSARARLRTDSVTESGDLQGMGTFAEADSESTRELLEEGNAFEADVVSGVERAGDEPERKIRTREVSEDDVPGEYRENE